MISTTQRARQPLAKVTPLVRSSYWSARCGTQVYFKMEALQTPGSFKVRGIGRVVERAKLRGADGVVSSSGGNAGMATAFAAATLGLKCLVVVPTTTPESVRDRLRLDYGATVLATGAVWDEANFEAERIADERGWPLVHPFENHDMWDGHSTLVDEVVDQLGDHDLKVDCVVVSVGGGGLLMGVLKGLERHELTRDVQVIATETHGAHSFAASLMSGHAAPLPGGITSVAKSLGAVTPSDAVVSAALAAGNVEPVIVSDDEALAACRHFAQEQRLLVEPACGAALAVLVEPHSAAFANRKCVVVVVCGGAVIDTDLIFGPGPPGG